MKLNKKGEFLILGVSGYAVLLAAGIISIGAHKNDLGKWGKNGTDSLMIRQSKHSHINTAPNSQRQTFDYYVQP